MLGISAFLLACTTVIGANQDSVLVYFTMNGCAACKAVEPTLTQWEQAGVVIRRVNADREPELAQRYQVNSYPTFVIVRGGREANRFVGAQSLRELYSALVQETPNRITNTNAAATASNLDGPATRLVPISSGLSGSADRNPVGEVAGEAVSAVVRAERATVRIRVYDGNGYGVGTGTIIDSHGEEALIITCGHIFRETQGKGRIEVDYFVGGRAQTLPGTLVDYDATTRDIGLISFRPNMPVVPVPVIGADQAPATGQSVFSFGCDHGADPSRRDTRVSAINKFQGPQNVEISGAPVEGRSGGGLFDQNGRLIGICNAADHQDDEGLYAGPQVIHWQLDRVELAHLYRGGQNNLQLAGSKGPTELNVTPASAIHGQKEMNLSPQFAEASNSLPSRDFTQADEEIICIVRSKSNPTEAPRVVTIPQPSHQLLDLINSSARR